MLRGCPPERITLDQYVFHLQVAIVGAGWEVNTAANGLVVNANDVTMYGLFIEH